MPPFFVETLVMREDCLNLRIARPADTKVGDGLPVVVWLHGGGVVKGSAYDLHFNPANLVAMSQDIGVSVIYVAMNY